MKKLITYIGMSLLLFATVFAADWSQGFEENTDGWFDYSGTIVRVPTGSDGITSADGAYHSQVSGFDYTQWGGYETDFPVCGYTTQIDLYLDTTWATGEDIRFDFSSAINNPAGDHRRDFIFHVGTVPSVVGQIAISASNNAPGWPMNPDRNPVIIDESGWYTFKHVFNDDAGILSVDLEVYKKSDGSLVGSWTLSTPADIIGDTVGGNRYGWFAGNGIPFNYLNMDNTMKTNCDENPAVPEFSAIALIGLAAAIGGIVLLKRR